MEDQYLNLAENYLSGNMDPDEMAAFEKEIQTNAELRQAYEETRMAMEAIDREAEKDLRSSFDEWSDEHSGDTVSREGYDPGPGPLPDGTIEMPVDNRRRTVVLTGIAASVLIMMSLIFFLRDTNLTPKLLAEEYYSLPEIAGSTMGTDEENWEQGLRAYESDDFQGAIDAWTGIEFKTPEVGFFLAHSHYQVGNYTEAARLFDFLRKGTSVYRTQCDWYIVLAFLANEDLLEFEEHLQIILDNPKHPFYTQAYKLNNQYSEL